MKHSPIQSMLRRLAEEAIPPAEVDLWPALRSQFETRKAHPQGDSSMKTNFANHRRLVFVAVPILAVFLVAALLMITPQGRAWARSALQFFTRTQSDTIPAPTSEPLVWVEQTPGALVATSTPLPPQAAFAAECGDYREPRCSIEQMRSKVNFTVQELASLPAGMYFIGATGGPQEAFIKYDTNDQSAGLYLSEIPWTGSAEQTGFEVAPGVQVETAPIGSATGEYVKGSFGYRSGETVETWMPDTGQETLKWSDQGVYYSIMYISHNIPLGKDRLASLAASLTSVPVLANLTPLPATATSEPTLDPNRWNADFPLTPAQASEQAGFKVWVPSKMPGNLSFISARYDEQFHLVELFYLLNCGDCDNSLYIIEQPATNGEECYFCGFSVGDYTAADANYPRETVGSNATIENVQIGDGTGQYVKGDWMSNNVTGFEWNNDWPTQRLLWEKDGMAFFLYDGTWGELEKADLIAIAESIR